MTLSRRKMIGLVGGGVVLAATVSAGGFLATRRPVRALAPWSSAGNYTEPRMRALSYAILAPNPHNRQPWMAELQGEDRLVIHRDKSRNLPETDPFDRQITIGFGCFIEQMPIAATIDDFATEVDPFPEGDGPKRPVARVRFIPGTAPDPLAAHKLDRRSCKEPFDMARPVAQGRIDLQSPLLEVLRRTGLLSRASLLDTEGAGFEGSMRVFRDGFAATPAFVWIATSGNGRENQIAAGRAWLRSKRLPRGNWPGVGRERRETKYRGRHSSAQIISDFIRSH